MAPDADATAGPPQGWHDLEAFLAEELVARLLAAYLVVCLDEMGPLSAKSYPGRDLVRPQPPPAGRARQEIDYGRRSKGYVFGAFCPATGAAFTRPYPGRGAANWVAFLEEAEGWLPQDVERVYAIADNLSSHRATDVLLFMLAHPRWEM